MWTKRQLINAAFEEAGLAAFVFDLSTDQIQSAGNRLDAMMAGLNQQGLQIGYNMSSVPSNFDPDQLSGLPDGAYELVISGLAMRIAPAYGKAISNDTRALYSRALNALNVQSAYPQNIAIPAGYPIGAGYKATPGYYSEFAPGAAESVSSGEQPLEFD